MRLAFIFCFVALVLIGCGDDDTCTLDSWLGTYTGIKTCNTDVADNYSFAVIRDTTIIGTSTDRIRLIIDDQSFTFDSETCEVFGGQTISIDQRDVTTSSWKDGELRIQIDYFGGGFCSWIGTKR